MPEPPVIPPHIHVEILLRKAQGMLRKHLRVEPFVAVTMRNLEPPSLPKNPRENFPELETLESRPSCGRLPREGCVRAGDVRDHGSSVTAWETQTVDECFGRGDGFKETDIQHPGSTPSTVCTSSPAKLLAFEAHFFGVLPVACFKSLLIQLCVEETFLGALAVRYPFH